MIRVASLSDLDHIDDIAKRAILDMQSSHIPQWDLSYPRKQHFAKDVEHGDLIVYELEGKVIAAMVLRPEQDPPYETITGWTAPHGASTVIHRVVVDPDYRRQGIFHQLMDYAETQSKQQGYQSIKIDTHRDNYKMRRFLEKRGFAYIGYLQVINREAYERTWEDNQ